MLYSPKEKVLEGKDVSYDYKNSDDMENIVTKIVDKVGTDKVMHAEMCLEQC